MDRPPKTVPWVNQKNMNFEIAKHTRGRGATWSSFETCLETMLRVIGIDIPVSKPRAVVKGNVQNNCGAWSSYPE